MRVSESPEWAAGRAAPRPLATGQEEQVKRTLSTFRYVAAFAVLAAFALAAVACSSAEEGEPTAAPAPTAMTAPAPTQAPAPTAAPVIPSTPPPTATPIEIRLETPVPVQAGEAQYGGTLVTIETGNLQAIDFHRVRSIGTMQWFANIHLNLLEVDTQTRDRIIGDAAESWGSERRRHRVDVQDPRRVLRRTRATCSTPRTFATTCSAGSTSPTT